MTRAGAVAYVGSVYAGPLADAAIPATDAAGALAEPIDDALRAMGYAEADLAAAIPADGAGFLALVAYHALYRVRVQLRDNMDIDDEGTGLRLNQLFKNAGELLAEAKTRVLAHWGALSPGPGADGPGSAPGTVGAVAGGGSFFAVAGPSRFARGRGA